MPHTIKLLVKLLLLTSIFYYHNLTLAAQDTVKMHRMNDQPIVVGKLNGKKAYFLVDSGADICILNKKDVGRYNIRYRKSNSKGNKISGLGSRLEGNILVAINSNFYLGNKKMEACFKVMDLSIIKGSIGSRSGVWINGIIGSDLMKKYQFIIDYSRQELSFTHFSSLRNTCL